MLRTKLLTLSAVTAAAALSLTACAPSSSQGGGGDAAGSSSAGESTSSGSGERLRIGIKFDQPGLGYREGSAQPTGFDTDVARYVADKLGAVSYTHLTLPTNREV